MKRRDITREMLLREYLEVDRNVHQACAALSCSPTTLLHALEDYGLPRKTKQWNRTRTNKYPQLQDRDWLAKQLETKTYREIAAEVGSTQGNVSDFVKRHGLRVEGDNPYRRGLRKKYPNGRLGYLAANWRGGKRRTVSGYVYVYCPDHPYATKDGYVMEHRLVIEDDLGHLLDPALDVHHRNEIKDDNRLENLVVMTRSQHKALHYHKDGNWMKSYNALRAENEQLRAQLTRYRDLFGDLP